MSDLFANHPPYARWAHILLRIFAGALVMQHGAQKLLGLFGGVDGAGATAAVGTIAWFGGWIELVAGTLVLVGLFTRPAAFILSGELAVAYFTVHAKRGFWPIINKGELAVSLCFIFLYLAATGAGAFSLDYIRTRKRPQPILP